MSNMELLSKQNILRNREEYEFLYNIEIPEINERHLIGEQNPEGFDDILEIDVESVADGIDKYDYIIAASSGILTAIMDVLWVKGLSLDDANKWGQSEAEDFVMNVSKRFTGYKGSDLRTAISKLEQKYGLASDSNRDDLGGGLLHHLNDFAHHPTLVGLIFSILSQFTGKAFGTDLHGNFKVCDIKNKELIGSTARDKITKGTIVWLFHLISDMAGSSGSPGKGTGIPGPLLATFKEFASLPIIKDITMNYKKENRNDEEIDIATFVSKLFSGTYFAEYNENGKIIKGTPLKFDLRTEMGIADILKKQAIPVIANECIVRGCYFVRQLCIELKKVSSLKELHIIDAKKVLPFNNRTVTRMITVSMSTFMTIVTAKAAIKAAKASKGGKLSFLKSFLLNINYPGLVRLVLSLRDEFVYFTEDMVYAYKTILNSYAKNETPWFEKLTVLDCLTLNEEQSKLLLSLEREMIAYDIAKSKSKKVKKTKTKWLNLWEKSIEIELIKSRTALYYELRNALHSDDNKDWIYLIMMELEMFEPYFSLNMDNDDDKEFVKLGYNNNYIGDVFYNAIDWSYRRKLSDIKKTLKRSIKIIEDKTIAKSALKGASIVAIGAATGGIAYAFAPGIAVTLVGGSMTGLSGAALTSASLAFIGGGSLAAGGFGMAGGTAIITGGGAVLGIFGSGALSSLKKIETICMGGMSAYACAKLLTFCKTVLIGVNGEYATTDNIHSCLKLNIADTEKTLMECKKEIHDITDRKEKKVQQAKIRMGESVLKHMRRCEAELKKLLKEYRKKYEEIDIALYAPDFDD